jgi:hypothetical protein
VIAEHGDFANEPAPTIVVFDEFPRGERAKKAVARPPSRSTTDHVEGLTMDPLPRRRGLFVGARGLSAVSSDSGARVVTLARMIHRCLRGRALARQLHLTRMVLS